MAALSDEQLIWTWLAPYTGATRKHHLRLMLEWWTISMKAGRRLLEVTPAMIESWAASERTRGLSKRSVNGELTTIITFYRWCFQQGHTDRDTGSAVRRPKNPRRSTLKVLGRQQLVMFLDAAQQVSPLAHSLVCLWSLNGLRLDETLTAKAEHLEHVDDQPVLWLPKRKLEQADRIAIPARTDAAIRTLLAGRTSGLIHRANGKKLTGGQVYTLLDRVSEIAGTGFNVRPHMLRATFITLSLEAGVPVQDVMNSAGHSSLSMVAYYDRGYRNIHHSASTKLADWLND